MKKGIFITLALAITLQQAQASMLDFALGAGTIFSGISALSTAGLAISQSNVNRQYANNLNLQNNILSQQAQASGYNLNMIQVQSYEQQMARKDAKEFVKQQRELAKQNNDTEMLTLIKRYYKPSNFYSFEFTQNKINELLEERKNGEQ